VTTDNIHKRVISIPPEGFESAILSSEQSQIHALDGAAIGIGFPLLAVMNYVKFGLMLVPTECEQAKIVPLVSANL
jgi:hypothetical protein